MEDYILDAFSPAENAPADDYACDLWLSFPKSLHIEDYSVSRERCPELPAVTLSGTLILGNGYNNEVQGAMKS